MKFAAALVADLVAVVVFAVIGRTSHGEGNALVGVAVTAAPFLVATVLGSLVARGLARRLGEPATIRRGLVVWSVTWVVGLVLRAVSGGGMAVSFVIVAAISLAVLLLGWRLVVQVMERVRGRDRASEPTS